MSTTRRSATLSTSRVVTLLFALAVVAVVGSFGSFVVSTTANTRELNRAITERAASESVVARGHVMVKTTSGESREDTGRRAARCSDDDPCWNPCTMGNMGPCDMGTELPYGGRFAVTVTPDQTMTCDAVNGVRYTSVAVTVSVVSADGVARHDGLTWYGCVLPHAPFAGGSPVDLAPMFRIVAGQL